MRTRVPQRARRHVVAATAAPATPVVARPAPAPVVRPTPVARPAPPRTRVTFDDSG
jgi:hypothetical protein